MKKRNLFTNILSILIILALAFFLLVQFNVVPDIADSTRNMIGIGSLAVAILSVIMIDIVFPVIDNKARLSENKYRIFLIVKVVLFATAVTMLLLFHPFGVIKETWIAMVTFIALYFAQFFINLDAKPDDDDDEDDDEYEDTIEEQNTEDVVEESYEDEISDEGDFEEDADFEDDFDDSEKMRDN